MAIFNHRKESCITSYQMTFVPKSNTLPRESDKSNSIVNRLHAVHIGVIPKSTTVTNRKKRMLEIWKHSKTGHICVRFSNS